MNDVSRATLNWLVLLHVLQMEEDEEEAEELEERKVLQKILISRTKSRIPSFIYVKMVAANGGRKKNSTNFSNNELMSLLETMKSLLPIGSEEWEAVVVEHFGNYPSPGRDANSIRRKYTTLHRRKIPTGDPNMPPAVRLA